MIYILMEFIRNITTSITSNKTKKKRLNLGKSITKISNYFKSRRSKPKTNLGDSPTEFRTPRGSPAGSPNEENFYSAKSSKSFSRSLSKSFSKKSLRNCDKPNDYCFPSISDTQVVKDINSSNNEQVIEIIDKYCYVSSQLLCKKYQNLKIPVLGELNINQSIFHIMSRDILSQKTTFDEKLRKYKYDITTDDIDDALNKIARALEIIFKDEKYEITKNKIIDQVQLNPKVITLKTIQTPKTVFTKELKYSAYEFAIIPYDKIQPRKDSIKYVIEELSKSVAEIKEHVDEVNK